MSTAFDDQDKQEIEQRIYNAQTDAERRASIRAWQRTHMPRRLSAVMAEAVKTVGEQRQRIEAERKAA